MFGKIDPVVFSAYREEITSLAFGTGDELLLAVSEEYDRNEEELIGVIRYWRVADQTMVKSVHDIDCTGFASFPRCGRYFVWGGKSGWVHVFDKENGSRANRFVSGEYHVYGVDFSQDGNLIAAASDKGLELWDVGKGRSVAVLEGSELGFRCASFDTSCSKVCGGDWDGSVQVWSASSPYKTLARHALQTDVVRSVKFIENDSVVVSVSGDRSIVRWNLKTQRPEQVIREMEEEILCLAYHSGVNLAASGSDSGKVEVWEEGDLMNRKNMTGKFREVTALSFSETGRILAAGDASGKIAVWQ